MPIGGVRAFPPSLMPPVSSHPLSILVVDDEGDVRNMLVEYFRELGHLAESAADGPSAVAAITARPSTFGIVICDLQLPGVDGLGVLKAAKAADPSIAVIIMTGYASVDSAVRAVRLGAYDYLTKPFTLGQIEGIVNRAAGRQVLDRGTAPGDSPGAVATVGERLDAIEARLARLELALDELSAERTSR